MLLIFVNVLFLIALYVINGPIFLSPDSAPTTNGKGKAPSQRAGRHHEPYKNAQLARGKGSGAYGSAKGNGDDASSLTASKSKRRGAVAGNYRLFGCPFYKYNPIQHKDCLLRNRLTETSFVVQHLARSHKSQPIHCPICGEMFDRRNDCDDHIRLQSCERRIFHHKGLTEDQLNHLREPRRGLNEADRWYRLWNIIFPNILPPDSPYVGTEYEEMIGVIRRAWAAVRQNHPGAHPLAAFLVNHQARHGAQPYGPGELDNIVATTESTYLSWSSVMSIIPRQDDLSFLTSDRQAQASPTFPPLSSVGDDNANQPPQPPQPSQPSQQLQPFLSPPQPLPGVDQATGIPLPGDGSPAVDGPLPISNNVGSYSLPSLPDQGFDSSSFGYFEITNNEMIDFFLPEEGQSSASIPDACNENSLDSHQASGDGDGDAPASRTRPSHQ